VRLDGEGAENDVWYRLRWGSFRSREEAEENARTRCTGLAWTLARAPAAAP
jgi:cell division protein FtsN